MTTLKAANRLEQEAERRSRKCRPIVTCMEQVPVLTVHASRKRTPPIQRQLGGGGSGMLVKAECQQEVEAAHPAPAWQVQCCDLSSTTYEKGRAWSAEAGA